MGDYMNEDAKLYEYYMANWQGCSRYSMAEFIHKLYMENKRLKADKDSWYKY